ncbi:MAG TPA: NAD-dependent 4,6-dehydratase LegB [Nitrospira sp.]|nr:NAD-dependent 4,6-dehydratase LegB [Nitrospira sp.]
MRNISRSPTLVTGADGFIGSHLVETLVARGMRVRALAFYNSFNDWGWLEQIGCRDQVEVVTGDIRDANFVRSIVADTEVVFNLAALIAIPYSYVAPDSYVQTNINGALHIAQAARALGVKRVVQVSTSEVYGSARYVPIDEKHPLQPQSPYSATKIGADAVAMSFYHAFGLPVVVARPFNTYGPRQSARAVIPTVITQLLAGRKSIKLGSLHPTRDFNYVEDTCRGLVALAECDAAIGKTVNIGSGSEVSIGECAKMICELCGMDAKIVSDDVRIRPTGSEVERLWCDNTLLRGLTGFEPSFSLREGLKRTIEWFRKPGNLVRYKVDLYNV